MAKFYGKIGYCRQIEKEINGRKTGVWIDDTIEKPVYGDVIRIIGRWDKSQEVNDNVSLNNQLSIVADSFACDNVHFMKYIIWNGIKWKITSVDLQYPRMTLSIGGLYNENET